MTQPDPTPLPTPPIIVPTPAPEPPADELTALRSELAEARREAAKYRTTARTAQEAERERMTEAERQAADLRAREANLNEREAAITLNTERLSVSSAAGTLGFRDPADAYALVASELDRDKTGAVTNLDAALKDLLRRKPYLGSGTQQIDQGGARGAGATTSSMSDLIRQGAGRA